MIIMIIKAVAALITIPLIRMIMRKAAIKMQAILPKVSLN